jgi:hypothetical protein
MITILATLACIGLLLLLGSRFLLLRQMASQHWSVRAAVWLPLGDLVYLAGAWHRHQAPALCSVLGAALLLPIGGQILWETRHPQLVQAHASLRTQLAGLLKTDLKTAAVAAAKKERDDLWMSKSAKVDALTDYLAVWHASLQSRRPLLAASPAEVVLAYNKEAAAYHEFLSVAKLEKAALTSMPAPEGSQLSPPAVN